jgi:hypothetical protein
MQDNTPRSNKNTTHKSYTSNKLHIIHNEYNAETKVKLSL